jgi:transcription antitermination factor NusG
VRAEVPILKQEIDMFPADLLQQSATASADHDSAGGVSWWALYTLARQEKQLMRQLRALQVPFYCPLVTKRQRSPAGRIRESYLPLFAGYVFIWASEQQRITTLTTNRISRCLPATNGAELTEDLRRVRALISVGHPLTPESRLDSGMQVRVRSGVFAGFEGTILRRDKGVRLLVSVRFLQQGVSVELDDCQLERLD